MCEIREKVELYRVNITCPICKGGYMLPTGNVLRTYPISYQHRCNNCGYVMNYDRQYPYYEDRAIQVQEDIVHGD